MRFYRVHFHLDSAKAGEDGHPLYVWPKQTAGRITNPMHYQTLYVAESPACAVAESFASQAIWTDDLFNGPSYLAGSVRALSEYEGSPSLLDLDDANNLLAQGIRPSRVVTRHYTHTRAWALGVYQSVGGDGVRWWSYHDPDWGSLGLWDFSGLRIVGTVPLHRRHPSVIQAGAVLNRVWA